ncbi:IS982 family transposase [Candidatus Kapabacteria bacterium]|nr:IS982 family transposase [Candidatus Kapabacteria bacterium]
MIDINKITQIFCNIDDFCKSFLPFWNKKLIANGKKRFKPSKLSLSEVMTIEVLFHLSGYKTFKEFYLGYVAKHLRKEFPKLVSYNRMTELKQQSFVPLATYLKSSALNDCTGISFIDSTPLRVCHNRRIHQHKTFKGLAQRGQCSLGWFYGFKLHIITNDTGGIIDVMITPGNTDDRKPLKFKGFVDKLHGKLFGDKGYISKDLFNSLFSNGVHLVTKLKKNMKTKLLTPIYDAYHLRKRAIIETIFDQLKNICQVEHSRHRSEANYFNNIFSALIAYNFKDKKPSLKNNFNDTNQLILY